LCFLKAGHVEPTNVYREKDIPLQMRQAYTAFKQLLKNDQNLPANTIHGMWREMLAQYKKQPNHLIAGLLQSFKEAAIAHKFDPEKLTYRTGSEVIFDYQDLFNL